MKNMNLYFAVAQLALAVSILLNHFMEDSNLISFIIGFLTSLSIVFNIAYMLFLRKDKTK
jgi:hypothetical protein